MRTDSYSIPEYQEALRLQPGSLLAKLAYDVSLERAGRAAQAKAESDAVYINKPVPAPAGQTDGEE